MPYDRLVDLFLLSQHYSTEIISDPERTLIYKDATYEAGTFEEIHALGGTHRRYCVNASYSNPMMGRIGLPAFVTTFADFRSNMDELYFGSDAPAIWSVLGEYEFRNRVVIAGGAVTMSCLPNTAAVADVYRSPGRTRLPVDVPNCAASDVDFFCLAYENEPLDQHKARVERLCTRLTESLKEVESGIPVAALWKNDYTYTIVRVAAPGLQVVLKPFTSVKHLIANFDLNVCQFAFVNNFRGDLLATMQGVDAVTSRSLVAKPGMNAARLKKWMLRGFSIYAVEPKRDSWDHEMAGDACLSMHNNLRSLELETRLAVTCERQLIGMSGLKLDTQDLQQDWVLDMCRIGNIAATIAQGKAGPGELIYGGAGVPPAPSSDMFSHVGINKHHDPVAFVASLKQPMRETIDLGYLAYVTAAGPSGVLRMEEYPDHSNVELFVRSMFARPKTPCTVTLHHALSDSRARAALDSSVAHWARTRGVKIITAAEWADDSAAIAAAEESESRESWTQDEILA